MFPQEARLRNFTYASAMTLILIFKLLKELVKTWNILKILYQKFKNSYWKTSYYVEIKYLCFKTI